MSIFENIIRNIKDGEIDKDFWLGAEEGNPLKLADGAMDGICIYHMARTEVTDEMLRKIGEVIDRISADGSDKNDEFVMSVVNEYRVINIIDQIHKYIITNKDRINAGNLYKYGLHAMFDTDNAELVKFGMCIMELFEHEEAIKEGIRQIGYCEEFTIFTIFNIRNWENPNEEILNLAKKVSMWGRIHCVDYIEPETEEIKRWLLAEGVHNGVVPAYSGHVVYEKAGVEELLNKDQLTYEEIHGILDITSALLDEGPVRGISLIDNIEGYIEKVLAHALDNMPLKPDDCIVINEISDWLEDYLDEDNEVFESTIDAILCDKEVRESILKELPTGRYYGLAEAIGLPYKELLFYNLEENFDEPMVYFSISHVMDDAEYRKKVIDLFLKKLPLRAMACGPKDVGDVLNSSEDNKRLAYMLQMLREYPGEGKEFVLTGLQAEVNSTRYQATITLRNWVEEERKPLCEEYPDLYDVLKRVRSLEMHEHNMPLMDKLLAGEYKFDED